jgi:hypothetical protein
MMNSTTLQITTQVVGDNSLIGDVSTEVFRLQYREAVFQSLYSIHPTLECWQPAASSPLGSAGHRWPRP